MRSFLTSVFAFPPFQYKTERDGIVETRVEQKITIQSDGDPIDHDKALAEAIQVRIIIANQLREIEINRISGAIVGSNCHESRHDRRKD